MEESFKISPLGSELPTTIEGCHDLIRGLLVTIPELFKRVEKLESDNKKLTQENKELKERLKTNSSNSSLPPQRILLELR